MSAKNRADLITKLHKFVKKEFPVVMPPSNRSVIEHMLYGCCLENSTFEAADEAFAKLQENYFDWNEVRVTTAVELAEVMKSLSDPGAAAISLKKTLHGVFEGFYQFDIDFLRKENLSKAVTQFEKFKGVSPFVVSYVTQNGLAGHSIPLDRSAMLLFYTLGIATDDEVASGRVPGLERTIPKAKGVEFSMLVHQLAVAFAGSPFNTKIRDQLLKINKDAKDLFPKRGSRKKTTADDAVVEEQPVEEAPPKKAPAKNATKQKTDKKPTVKKKATKSKSVAAKPAKANKRTKAPARKKLPAKATESKSTAARKLAKKKPR